MEACILCHFVPRVDEDIKLRTRNGPICVSCYYRNTDDPPLRLDKKLTRAYVEVLNRLDALSWLTK